jgi:hypothetical protein
MQDEWHLREAAMPRFQLFFGLALAGAGLLAGTSAPCDEVLLRGGGRVSGVVVEQSARAVVIETGPGRVTLPMSRVLKVVESRSALAEFQERASALAANDVAGWTALARWAGDRELVTSSRSAWQRVLALDPQHPEANAALGRVSVDGTWMPADEAYRARGLVEYEGRWMTPAEHEAALRERALDQAAELQAREADARIREAEARAREAEARAAEAESSAESSQGGIPLLPYGYGYGYGGYGYGHAGNGYGYGVHPTHPIAPDHALPPVRPARRESAAAPSAPPAPASRPAASAPVEHHTAGVPVPPRQPR